MLLFVSILNVSVQNMVAYVMLPIVIFVLVYSLTISEVAVTFPDTSCFIPHWNTLCWVTCVTIPIFDYPKHVFLHYKANIEKSVGSAILHNVQCVSCKEFRW